MSLHYVVKCGCSKFLPNTGFVTTRLLRFGVKVKTTYCRDNFVAQRPLLDMTGCLETIFMFQQDGTSCSLVDSDYVESNKISDLSAGECF